MTEPNKYFERGVTYTVLGISIIIVGTLVFGFVLERYAIENIVPKPGKNRFDIHTLYMAPLDQVCPDLPSQSFEPQLEHCIASIDLAENHRPAALEKITIGTFEDWFQGRMVGFKDELEKQNKPHLLNVVRTGKSFIIGLSIPTKFFSYRQFGDDPYSLAFYGIRDANVCVDGRCSYTISHRGSFGSESVPLYWNPKRHNTKEVGDAQIFFVANDGAVPVGLVLNHGIFVVKDIKLYDLRAFFSMSGWMRPASLVFLLLGFFIICAVIGATTQYLDYVMLGYVAVSMIALVVFLAFKSFLTGADPLTYWRVHWFALFNFLMATLLFALATIREKVRVKLVVFTALVGYGGFLSWMLFLAPTDVATFIDNQWITNQSLGLCLFVSSPGVFFLDALRLWKKAHRVHREDLRISIRERIGGQITIGFNFLILGLLTTYVTRPGLPFSNLVQFMATWGGLFITIPAIVLLRSSHRRQKYLDKVASNRSESLALELGHGKKAAESYRARERSGILILPDLKNSTEVTEYLDSDMHWVMQTLRTLMLDTLGRESLIVRYEKPLGDSHLILASSHHEDLRKDFLTVVQAFRGDLIERFRPAVKFFHPHLDVRFHLFAVPAFRLGGQPNPITFEKENLDLLLDNLLPNSPTVALSDDFISRSANYLLRYVAPMKVDRMLVVGGPLEVFGQELAALCRDLEPVSKLMRDQKRPRALRDFADHQQLVFGLIPEEEDASRESDGNKLAQNQEYFLRRGIGKSA